MNRWQQLASWRQHPADRDAQRSFLDDIGGQWAPRTRAERWLERRSRLVHLAARLFDGQESLAPVAVALVPGAVATAVMGMAAPPGNPEYAGSPQFGYLLLTLGSIGLAYEAATSPRLIRPWRWSLLGALPIAAGSLFGAATMGRTFAQDRLLIAGELALGIGMLLIAALPAIRSRAAQEKWHRRGAVLSGIGLFLTVAGDLYWTSLFRAEGDDMWALGTGLVSISAWLFGSALIRCRPQLAPVGTATSA